VTPSAGLLKSSTFRLVAIYLLLFAVSVAAIIGYIYLNTIGILEQQVDETIRSEVLALAEEYQNDGLHGVNEMISHRTANDSSTIYILTDAANQYVSGNMQNLPAAVSGSEGWVDFPLTVIRGGNKLQHSGRAYHVALAGNYHVLVGRDVDELRQYGAVIRQALYIALALALLLGLGGGVLISRNFLRRVNAITDTSRGIMDGDMSRRMPLLGTGDELDRLSMSLNQMLDQIERLMKGMREVSSNVSHDLRTPLTRLRARAESALRTENASEYKAALESTLDESDQLLNIFNALLSISRAEAGQMRENFGFVDAGDILQEVAELYEPIVEDAGGELLFEMPREPLRVHADRQLLAQTISNLIDNALKYGHGDSGPHITISGDVIRHQIELTVADRGPGIAVEDRERVKERFVRLDQSRNLPGSGLGLSLVNSVAKLHNGSLVLEDNHPGLRAKIVLPQAMAIG
jgi:signal transduction histidine kinase